MFLHYQLNFWLALLRVLSSALWVVVGSLIVRLCLPVARLSFVAAGFVLSFIEIDMASLPCIRCMRTSVSTEPTGPRRVEPLFFCSKSYVDTTCNHCK